MAGLVVLGAGCSTIKIPDRDGRGYTELLGDLPKQGQVIRVRDVAGHETKGPYVTDMVWSYYDQETGVHFCTAKGGGFPGVGKPGTYAMVRYTKYDVYFVEVK